MCSFASHATWEPILRRRCRARLCHEQDYRSLESRSTSFFTVNYGEVRRDTICGSYGFVSSQEGGHGLTSRAWFMQQGLVLITSPMPTCTDMHPAHGCNAHTSAVCQHFMMLLVHRSRFQLQL